MTTTPRTRNVRIEAGKFYIDGHGHRRGPMEPRLTTVGPDIWGEPGSVDLWEGDGAPFDAPHSMHPELAKADRS